MVRWKFGLEVGDIDGYGSRTNEIVKKSGRTSV